MLQEIKQRLLQNAYKNEEHIRVQAVCRVFQRVGWDIWNPQEVYLE
jgi:predicted type IV restriction endonuclease